MVSEDDLINFNDSPKWTYQMVWSYHLSHLLSSRDVVPGQKTAAWRNDVAKNLPGLWMLTKTNIGQRSDNPWKKSGSCMRRAEVCSCLGPPRPHTVGSVGWFYQLGQVGTIVALVPEGPELIWMWWVRHNAHSIFHDNSNTDGQPTEKRSGSQYCGLVQANNRLTDWLETY